MALSDTTKKYLKISAQVLAVPFALGLIAVLVIYHPEYPPSSGGGGEESEDAVSGIANLTVNAGSGGRAISKTLFGVFFEEINHAGAGGLWAELVSNRGFEAGGQNVPSGIEPWFPVGSSNDVWLETDRTSPFERNKVALRVTVLCGSNRCPSGGVGVANPGFWGMNIVEGQQYQIIFWLTATVPVNLIVKFVSGDGSLVLASEVVTVFEADDNISLDWTKYSLVLEASHTDHQASLYITASDKVTFWLDQVSVMPDDTYKGHGFRKELAQLLEDLNPAFVRFPGGCYVEGDRLENAFRWRETVGPWQDRAGHFGDVWLYWTDDGLGYYEFLQLAEDLGSAPVWVFNNGIAHQNWISTDLIGPYVNDILDGIEFARGNTTTKWGALRSSMGHSEPFALQHIAIGNEDCWKPYYRDNYMAFYTAIKNAYPDIQIISNCDATSWTLDHPADMYDYHVYTNANNLFSMRHTFDQVNRDGPKVFVSEYAVTGGDSGQGSLLAALAEGAFMIGLEMNSDVVEMASYAPLFVHQMDRRWNPDAIVFNSWSEYGTPSYWVQWMFRYSSWGAYLLPVALEDDFSATPAVVSAIRRWDWGGQEYLTIKAVNFGSDALTVRISFDGDASGSIDFGNSTMATIASTSVWDENSFAEPKKVAPLITNLSYPNSVSEVVLPAKSIVALDLKIASTYQIFDAAGGHSDI